MGTRTEHAPGTFSWIDLTTSDQEAAKGFYGELIGWDFDDMPVGDTGQVYSMAKIDGAAVAAISGQQPGDPSPPHWNNYVTVESADDAAAKAKEAGGTVMMDAFDVLDSGRMAVLQDPAGAILCVWQPKSHIGAELVNVPGALTWNELGTPEVDGAARFYGDLFGWNSESMPTGDGPRYVIIKVGERTNGGIREQTPEEQAMAPPYWLPYIAVESTDNTVERAGTLGASTILPPMDVPAGNGRIAMIQDPQGAYVAFFQGEFDD